MVKKAPKKDSGTPGMKKEIGTFLSPGKPKVSFEDDPPDLDLPTKNEDPDLNETDDGDDDDDDPDFGLDPVTASLFHVVHILLGYDKYHPTVEALIESGISSASDFSSLSDEVIDILTYTKLQPFQHHYHPLTS